VHAQHLHLPLPSAGSCCAELEARFCEIQDPTVREARRLAVMDGMAAPSIPAALRCYDNYLSEMEEALGNWPYLAGDTYSLVDAAVTPYIYRAEMLGLDELWLHRRPHVIQWFARVRERPSFEQAITGVLTDLDKERLRVAREQSWPRAREILGTS
jgi:glutathione S-transferase